MTPPSMAMTAQTWGAMEKRALVVTTVPGRSKPSGRGQQCCRARACCFCDGRKLDLCGARRPHNTCVGSERHQQIGARAGVLAFVAPQLVPATCNAEGGAITTHRGCGPGARSAFLVVRHRAFMTYGCGGSCRFAKHAFEGARFECCGHRHFFSWLSALPRCGGSASGHGGALPTSAQRLLPRYDRLG